MQEIFHKERIPAGSHEENYALVRWFTTVVILRISQPQAGDWLACLGWAWQYLKEFLWNKRQKWFTKVLAIILIFQVVKSVLFVFHFCSKKLMCVGTSPCVSISVCALHKVKGAQNYVPSTANQRDKDKNFVENFTFSYNQ